MKPGGPISTLDLEAARWRTRCAADLSPADEAELARWLEDPMNAEAFAAMDRTWDRLDRVKGSAVAPRLEAELARIARPVVRPWKVRMLWLTLPLAAAACLTLAYVGWWRPAHFGGSFTTAVGQVTRLALPDGSTVRLNTDSALVVQFTPERRAVQLLRGEAHFEVAKNPVRPFAVGAAGVEVQAVGTAFGVRLRTESVEVLVTEGKVALNQHADPSGTTLVSGTSDPTLLGAGTGTNAIPVRSPAIGLFLTAGQKAVISLEPPALATLPAPPGITTVSPPEIERSLAWQDKRLVFVSAPLRDIVAEFNRFQSRKLVIEDESLAGQRFGGTFEADDPETFLQLLESSAGIMADPRPGELVLRRRR